MSATIPPLPTRLEPPPAARPITPAKPSDAAPPVTLAADAKIPEKRAADTPRHPAEHHAASALSPSDIGYVDSLMGVAPPQAMEYIMLKTGVPMPANLGQDIDTTA